MEDIAHVMPILPIPLLCTVFLQNRNKPLRSLDINIEVKKLIRIMIENGAAMKKREQPRNRTLQESLNLLVDRKMVLEKNDRYQINEELMGLNQYYANSIAHWLNQNGLKNSDQRYGMHFKFCL